MMAFKTKPKGAEEMQTTSAAKPVDELRISADRMRELAQHPVTMAYVFKEGRWKYSNWAVYGKRNNGYP